LKALMTFGTQIGLAVALGALGVACGSGGNNGTGSTTGTSMSTGTGMSTSSGTTGTGGTTSSSTTGSGGAGGGGAGGGTAAGSNGPPATQLVSAGSVATSHSYKMVFTMGQPTQNQSRTTSPSYQMQGGLVGANGSLP
jgi:hypothetical protein